MPRRMSAATASPQINGQLLPTISNGSRKRKSLQTSLEALGAVQTIPKLPLKKRFYAPEKDPSPLKNELDESDQPCNSSNELSEDGKEASESGDQPVDFSLPNRIRAKSTPSKNSVKSEPGLSHSPSDTTAASVSPANSDSELKPLDDSGSVQSPTNSHPQQLILQSAFTPTTPWSQPAFLEALRLSSGRFNSSSIPPLFHPGLGLSPFPMVPNLSALAGSFPPASPGLFPPAGPIFQSAPAADLNLLKTLSLAASSSKTQVNHASDKSSQSPRPPVVSGNSIFEEEADRSVASPESFVINPATGNKVRKNYKNMTRERRVEANARERTRVHTIGSAFENIRKLLPCLAPDQKLSKLSILRVACKYILLLAAMNGKDYSAEQRGYTVEECVEMLNETIISESKAKRIDR